MSFITRFAALFLILVATAVAAQGATWPALPTHGFVADRPATQADMNAGDAIFILQQHPDPVDSKGESIPVSHYGQVSEGKPMHIAIPQYAYYLHKGRKVRVIVVQAEKSKHETLVGARTLDGRDLSGPLAEFQLLGEHPPKRSAP